MNRYGFPSRLCDQVYLCMQTYMQASLLGNKSSWMAPAWLIPMQFVSSLPFMPRNRISLPLLYDTRPTWLPQRQRLDKPIFSHSPGPHFLCRYNWQKIPSISLSEYHVAYFTFTLLIWINTAIQHVVHDSYCPALWCLGIGSRYD